MKKFIALTAGALLALPAIASAQIVGECSACHTMHNSEQGAPVAEVGNSGTKTSAPIQNLLKLDCVGCHAMGTGSSPTMPLGESSVPQVMHAGGTLDGLAGGNFRFGMGSETALADRNVHNVKDIAWGYTTEATVMNSPPGLTYNFLHGPAFSSEGGTPFDNFTCAGARGCHGTRSQLLTGHTSESPDGNGDGNPDAAVYVGEWRTGIAAITGAHHLNSAGAKQDLGYTAPTVHDGQTVASGYRFIPGLWGFEVADWVNTNTSHNEYYGIEKGIKEDVNASGDSRCQVCHIEQSLHDPAIDDPNGTANWGMGTRMGLDSTLITPNNSMSGFCSSCHGDFHSSGAAGDYGTATWTDEVIIGDDAATTDVVETSYAGSDGVYDTYSGETVMDGDYVKNGVSGAFLRHPSDYTIPNRGEYAAYTSYDITAPVARTTVLTAPSAAVTPGADLVMCLSCHVPHGSEFDYLLRFDYSAAANLMDAGKYLDQAAAQAAGGCLACHSAKGVNRE